MDDAFDVVIVLANDDVSAFNYSINLKPVSHTVFKTAQNSWCANVKAVILLRDTTQTIAYLELCLYYLISNHKIQ